MVLASLREDAPEDEFLHANFEEIEKSLMAGGTFPAALHGEQSIISRSMNHLFKCFST